jgi:hypothetical protein
MLYLGTTRSSSVLKAVRGVIFLGTPHLGSNAAPWELAMQRIIDISADLIDFAVLPDFAAEGQELQRMIPVMSLLEFLQRQLQIYTFIETDSVSYSCYMSLRRLLLIICRLCHQNVQSYPNENYVKVDKKHQDICKFSDLEDPHYILVAYALEEIIRKAESDVES